MGGKGSGFTKEKRLVNAQLGRNKSKEVMPAGEQFAIPNHSGDHSAGTTGTPVNDSDIANKKYVDDTAGGGIWSTDGSEARLIGDEDIHMQGQRITMLANPTEDADAMSKGYADDNYVDLTGGTMTGTLYLDALPLGLDVLYSAEIGNHLTVGNNIIVGGTVDGIDIGVDVAANTLKDTSMWETSGGNTQLKTADDILLPTTDKIMFRDAGILIHSYAANKLLIDGSSEIKFVTGAGTIVMSDAASSLDLATWKITNLGYPAANADAASKLYVDSIGRQFFAYKTSEYRMAAVNTWYDLTWADLTAPVKIGFTHDHTSNPEQITVTDTGTYRITININFFARVANQMFTVRVLDDAAEIQGSFQMRAVAGYSMPISKTFIASITAGSVIEVQVGTNSAVAGNQVARYNDASLPNPVADVVASISISRV